MSELRLEVEEGGKISSLDGRMRAFVHILIQICKKGTSRIVRNYRKAVEGDRNLQAAC